MQGKDSLPAGQVLSQRTSGVWISLGGSAGDGKEQMPVPELSSPSRLTRLLLIQRFILHPLPRAAAELGLALPALFLTDSALGRAPAPGGAAAEGWGPPCASVLRSWTSPASTTSAVSVAGQGDGRRAAGTFYTKEGEGR